MPTLFSRLFLLEVKLRQGKIYNIEEKTLQKIEEFKINGHNLKLVFMKMIYYPTNRTDNCWKP